MAKENNVNTILADIYQISADINIQNTPNLIPNESLFTLRMFYSFYGVFLDCSVFVTTETSHIKCNALSYVHHTKDPRVCPTGSPVQCCPSLSQEELYLPTTHTQKENRSFIKWFSCQQVKHTSAQALTKTDTTCHMQSYATSIFFTPLIAWQAHRHQTTTHQHIHAKRLTHI